MNEEQQMDQLNQINNIQTKYLQAMLKELQKIRGNITAILIIQLIPIITGLITLIIGIILALTTGISIFSLLNQLLICL